MWLRSRLATIDARSLIFHFAHIVRSFSFLIPYFSFLILKSGVYWAATVAGFRASVVP